MNAPASPAASLAGAGRSQWLLGGAGAVLVAANPLTARAGRALTGACTGPAALSYRGGC